MEESLPRRTTSLLLSADRILGITMPCDHGPWEPLTVVLSDELAGAA
jgi:hypothetical protein